MSKAKISNVTEREEVIGQFEFHGFKNIMEHDIEGIEENKLPRFTLLYKYEKGKNFFVFITTKRSGGYIDNGDICDISTQMLVIKRKEDIKMVARNQFFDASDNVGNIVHVELDSPLDAVSILKQVLTFKK
jgi:hypothetical protein